jgi:pyrroline-5-carboxylate reductase
MNACITVYLLIENMQESVAKVGFSRASSQTLLRLTLNSQD